VVDTFGVCQQLAVSRKLTLWKLMPRTDGRFAFYPGSPWYKGYVLTADQARELFGAIEKKGISFNRMIIIFVVLSLSGINFSYFEKAFGIENVLLSGWFYIFFLTFVFVADYVEALIKIRRLHKRFEDLPICEHPFPRDYFRLKTLTVGFFKTGFLLVMTGVMSFFMITSVFILFDDEWTSSDSGLLILAIVFCFVINIWLLKLLYYQTKFRRLNGRQPRPSDLGPVDPQTGRMAKHPFKEPM